MKTYAIIFVYHGVEPNEFALGRMIQALVETTGVDSNQIEPVVLSENELRNGVILRKEHLFATLGVQVENICHEKDPITPQTKAAVAIGERFKEALKCRYTYDFNTHLMYAYISASAKGCDPELLRAVEILAKEKDLSNIDGAILEKYNFNSVHLSIIREIYQTTCAAHISM